MRAKSTLNTTCVEPERRASISKIYGAAISACRHLERKHCHIVALTMVTALGNEDDTEAACREALEDGFDSDSMRETLLQSYIYLGFPRAINALHCMNRALTSLKRNPSEGLPANDDDMDLETRQRKGKELFTEINRAAQFFVRRWLTEAHPLIGRWLVEQAYGLVLSRDGLTPREREFAINAALISLGATPQMETHLRGALNLGSTPEELGDLITIAAHLLDGQRASTGKKILASCLKAVT